MHDVIGFIIMFKSNTSFKWASEEFVPRLKARLNLDAIGTGSSDGGLTANDLIFTIREDRVPKFFIGELRMLSSRVANVQRA